MRGILLIFIFALDLTFKVNVQQVASAPLKTNDTISGRTIRKPLLIIKIENQGWQRYDFPGQPSREQNTEKAKVKIK